VIHNIPQLIARVALVFQNRYTKKRLQSWNRVKHKSGQKMIIKIWWKFL
jgi:hypothetical protein